MKSVYTAIVLLILYFQISNAADSTLVEDSTLKSIENDTVLYLPRNVEGTAIGVTDPADHEKKLIQNPTLALFKSMLVPGLGQIGNRQYVKAGVIIGLEAWLISSAVKNGNDASDFRKQFNAATDLDERNSLYDQYLDSKDERNKFTWFAAIVTFVSMFDAFSDAHLSGFPKEPDKSTKDIELNFRPDENDGVYASLTYSF